MLIHAPHRSTARPLDGPDPGPGLAGGRARPDAHALKFGLPEEITRVPEDAEAVTERSRRWYTVLLPQTVFQAWLVDQVTITTLRIERNARIERRLRDRSAARAEQFWDDDRRLDAERIGAKLADQPASTVNRLRRTPQGCDWLIDRWARLARIADVDGGWDEAEVALAFGLLGTPPEGQVGPPGGAIDERGCPVGESIGPAALARREVAALLARRAEVAAQDAIDRALAEADLVDEPSPEFRRLRSYEATLHSRLRWLLAELRYDSPRKRTNPDLFVYFDPEFARQNGYAAPPAPVSAAAPEPSPEPSAPAAGPDRPDEAVPEPPRREPAPSPAPPPLVLEGLGDLRPRRVEPRRESRRRRRERRRA